MRDDTSTPPLSDSTRNARLSSGDYARTARNPVADPETLRLALVEERKRFTENSVRLIEAVTRCAETDRPTLTGWILAALVANMLAQMILIALTLRPPVQDPPPTQPSSATVAVPVSPGRPTLPISPSGPPQASGNGPGA